jgi:hypothetical protein
MATIFTNQVIASALKGQCVVVSLNATDTAKIPNIKVGQSVVSSGANPCEVAEIFLGGNTFLVRPLNLAARFDSATTPGQLAVGETITF